MTTGRLQSWRERQLLATTAGEPDQASFTFTEIVCLKAGQRLDELGIPTPKIQSLLEVLHDRISEIDERLRDRTVSVFEDRIVITRKTHFVSTAGRALVRFDLDELIERMTACVAKELPALTADEWFEEGKRQSQGDGSARLALAAFRETLRLDSTRTDAYLEMGRIHYREGQLLDAERSLRLALRRDPYRRDTLYVLGRVMEGENRLEEAMSFYERALDADPSFGNAQYRLGQVYAKNAEWEHALKHWRNYLTLTPNSAHADFVKRQIEDAEQELALAPQ